MTTNLTEVDYIEVARKSGLQGQRGRDVEVSVRQAVKTMSTRLHVKITLINKPGTILETSNGSYKVMRNGTLLALNPDAKVQDEIDEIFQEVTR